MGYGIWAIRPVVKRNTPLIASRSSENIRGFVKRWLDYCLHRLMDGLYYTYTLRRAMDSKLERMMRLRAAANNS
jgi:hypothetical protein